MKAGDYFGIRFYPGALRNFFDLNLSEITNQFVDKEYFPCRDFGSLHQEIYQRHDFFERKQLCEKWLLTHLKIIPANQFDHALTLIYQSFLMNKFYKCLTEVFSVKVMPSYRAL
jgi:hypothetical protein